MKQFNKIGKYTKKDEYLNSKKNIEFITPKNRKYFFDYIKEGRKYFFYVIYKDTKMKVSESDYNKTNIDILIDAIIKGNKIK